MAPGANEKVRIGIIGCGGIANAKHMPSLKTIKNVEMVAFCDIIVERAEKAAKDFGIPGAKVYEDYIEKIRAASTKVYMVPGNHDLPKVDEPHLSFYRQHFGEDRWAFKYRNCAFIGLNSSIMQIGSPEQEATHFKWLEGQLKKFRKCRYKFIFMHISFFTHDMDEKEEYFNQPKSIREKYMKLLDEYHVNAVFCGHLHKNAYGKYKNVEVVTSNAVGMDLTGEDKHGMTLIEISPSGYTHKYMTFDEFKE